MNTDSRNLELPKSSAHLLHALLLRVLSTFVTLVMDRNTIISPEHRTPWHSSLHSIETVGVQMGLTGTIIARASIAAAVSAIGTIASLSAPKIGVYAACTNGESFLRLHATTDSSNNGFFPERRGRDRQPCRLAACVGAAHA
jgi:hypothetical protein